MNVFSLITIDVAQEYVRMVRAERGFGDDSARELCALLLEEAGELSKAVRQAEGGVLHEGTDTFEIAKELADCMIVLFAIAILYGIAMSEALMTKIQLDWKKKYYRERKDGNTVN